MTDDIAKVRERVSLWLKYGGSYLIDGDIAALLADHARLEALSVPVLWQFYNDAGECLSSLYSQDGFDGDCALKAARSYMAGPITIRAYALISTERVEPT